ncbi:MAG: hypothetical protein WBA57_27825 [Elainellaceae cyanobacterium]
MRLLKHPLRRIVSRTRHLSGTTIVLDIYKIQQSKAMTPEEKRLSQDRDRTAY